MTPETEKIFERHRFDRALMLRALGFITRAAADLSPAHQLEAHGLLTEFELHALKPNENFEITNNEPTETIAASKPETALPKPKRRAQSQGADAVSDDGANVDGGDADQIDEARNEAERGTNGA